MSSTDFDIESIFNRAREISEPESRAEFLEVACAGRPSIRQRIEALLSALEEAGDFLETADRGNHLSPIADALFRSGEAEIGEQVGSQLGPYRIVEKIGEGGFGAVYLATQAAPVRRKVALKIIKFGMDTRRVVARFEAERQALAMMDHPNIARVFDAGATDSGRPYFVMELVKGMPITEYCDGHKLNVRERLRLFVDVCAAVQHAHQKGVIHRDLKPSNVLISQYDDKPSIKVIDFGVAKATAEPLTEKTLVTGIRQLVGTPLYMSPEQAGQSDLDIDTRSDIYTLGVLLYELLTGTLPFDPANLEGSGYAEIQRLICEVDPPRPSSRLSRLTRESSSPSETIKIERRQLIGLLRGDLDAIVMKCLEKSRERRYESAASLAEDINRYLDDEVVHARAPGFGYRAKKFIHRNRIAVVASVVIVFALVVGASFAVWGMIQAQQDRDNALAAKSAESEQRQIATARAESLRRELYRSTIMRISDIVNSGTADPIKADLDSCDRDLIHWEWRRLRLLADTSKETITTDAGTIRDLQYDPTGERYLLAEDSEKISLRSSVDHHPIKYFVQNVHGMAARDIRFSLDGSRAASVNDANNLFVWDVKSGQLIRRIDLEFGNLLSVALDGEGSRVAVGAFWEDTLVLDVESGIVLHRLKSPAHRARSLQFFDGGRLLMIGSLESDVCVFDADRGEMLWNKPAGEFVVWSATVSPDERTIVATSGDARIVGFDAKSGEQLFDKPTRKVERGAMAIDNNTGLIFLGSEDGLITAYHLDTGERRFVLRGHEAGVRSLAVNPRNGSLYSTSQEGVIKRWNTGQDPDHTILTKHHNILLTAQFSNDGSSVLYGGHRNGLQIYDLIEKKTTTQNRAFEDVGEIRVLANGGAVVSGGAPDSFQPSVMILSPSGDVLHQWHSESTEIQNRIAVNDDRSLVLSVPFERGLSVWNVESGRQVCRIEPTDVMLSKAVFAHDGNSIISIDEGNYLDRWSLKTGEHIERLGRCGHHVTSLITSFDGKWLVCGLESGLIEIRDAASGEVLRELYGHIGKVRDLALTSDDRRLVSGGNDTYIRLWDPESGKLLMKVGQHAAAVTSVAFDNEASTIVSCGEDHTLLLWESADMYDHDEGNSSN